MDTSAASPVLQVDVELPLSNPAVDSLAAVPEGADMPQTCPPTAGSPAAYLQKRSMLRTDSASSAPAPRTGGSPEDARALKRASSKSVRFSNSTDTDDDDDFPFASQSMVNEGGKQWKSLGEFAALKEIYRGRVSLVASATCKKSHKSVVLKAYIKSRLSKSLTEMVHREIRLHGEVRFLDGVTELLGWFEDDLQIVLVLEHCSGGDVYRRLVLEGGQMAESAAVTDVLHPLVKAMLRIHKKNITHRDLKPENLFYACSSNGERQLKLGDFGLASDLQDMRDRVGTLDYMAPEILLQQDETAFAMMDVEGNDKGGMAKVADGPYTSKVDVWAVGIIAYELLTGRPPFEVNSPHETALLIVWGTPEFPDYVSASAREFILMALQKEPGDRPSMLELLQHPFIVSHSEIPLLASSKRAEWLRGRASFKLTKRESSDGEEDSAIAEDARAQQFQINGQQTRGRLRRGVTSRDIPASMRAEQANKGLMLNPFKSQRKSKSPKRVPISMSQPHNRGSFDKPNLPVKAAMAARPALARPSRPAGRGMSDDSCHMQTNSPGQNGKPMLAPRVMKKVRMSDHSVTSDNSSNSATTVPGRSSMKASPTSILKKTEGQSSFQTPLTPSLARISSSRRAMSLTGTESSPPVSEPWDRKASLFSRFFSSLMCGRASMDGEMSGSPPNAPVHRGSDGSVHDRHRRSSMRISAASGGQSSDRASDGTSVSVSFDTPAGQSSSCRVSDTSDTTQRTPDQGNGSNRGLKRHSSMKKSASRVGMGLSRFISRIFIDDDAAPWNTNGAHLKGLVSHLRNAPDMDTLEAMKANAKSSTRNRMKEYMVRRGGDNETTRQSLAHENMPAALVAAEAVAVVKSGDRDPDAPNPCDQPAQETLALGRAQSVPLKVSQQRRGLSAS